MTKQTRRRILFFLLAALLFLTLAIPLVAQLNSGNLVNVIGTLQNGFGGTVTSPYDATVYITPTPTV